MIINPFLNRIMGYLRRPTAIPYEALLNIDEDVFFNSIYNQSLTQTSTEHRPARKSRMFHLHQLVHTVSSIEGDIVECGCWKGASAHLMMSSLKKAGSQERRFWLFDSFEGLSQPSTSDLLKSQKVARLFNKETGKPFKAARSYSCGKEAFDSNLSFFRSQYSSHRVWIDKDFPSYLSKTLPSSICFANIDLDLHDPTYWAFDACIERLSPGGIICCDDYGSLSWPGARKAVDTVVEKYNMKKLELSSGQAIVFF